MVNGQLANFVKRVPQNEAPFIAEFFLLCNDPYYRRTQHSTGALVKDAEALRTRWQTQSTGDPGHVGRQEQVEAGNAELVRRLTNRGPNS